MSNNEKLVWESVECSLVLILTSKRSKLVFSIWYFHFLWSSVWGKYATQINWILIRIHNRILIHENVFYSRNSKQKLVSTNCFPTKWKSIHKDFFSKLRNKLCPEENDYAFENNIMSRVKPHDEGITEIRAPWGGSRGEPCFPRMPENAWERGLYTGQRIIFTRNFLLLQDELYKVKLKNGVDNTRQSCQRNHCIFES